MLDSSLKHLDENEINMFKVGVEFLLTNDWPTPTFIIKPKIFGDQQAEEGDFDALDQ